MKIKLLSIIIIFCLITGFFVYDNARGNSAALKIGDKTDSFKIYDVSGPNKGKNLCYICASKGAPSVIGFMKDQDKDTVALAVKIDKLVSSYGTSGVKGFIVFTAGMDKKEAIEKIASDNKITLPLVVPQDGDMKEINSKYKIDDSNKNTVIVSKGNQISFIAFNVTEKNFTSVSDALKNELK